MDTYLFHTNNPLLPKFFKEKNITTHEVKLVTSSILEVLKSTRGAVSQGSRILYESLIPFIPEGDPDKPPFINPYKSIILSKPKLQVDFRSIQILEEALSFYRQHVKQRYMAFGDAELNVFQALDLDGILSGLYKVEPSFITEFLP